jgi:hypothetical protein
VVFYHRKRIVVLNIMCVVSVLWCCTTCSTLKVPATVHTSGFCNVTCLNVTCYVACLLCLILWCCSTCSTLRSHCNLGRVPQELTGASSPSSSCSCFSQAAAHAACFLHILSIVLSIIEPTGASRPSSNCSCFSQAAAQAACCPHSLAATGGAGYSAILVGCCVTAFCAGALVLRTQPQQRGCLECHSLS